MTLFVKESYVNKISLRKCMCMQGKERAYVIYKRRVDKDVGSYCVIKGCFTQGVILVMKASFCQSLDLMHDT